MFSGLGMFWGNLGGDKQFPTRNQVMTKIFPKRANYPPLKGTKTGGSTRGAAVLELGDPLGSGPGCHSRGPLFFFFFFFFFTTKTLEARSTPSRTPRRMFLLLNCVLPPRAGFCTPAERRY
eukprot:FR737526.1.p2 GENE.FR737526.1~~FR737526.1.p2  ORF type:complete len:121 (-),score=32.20 FR737526.1:682-1044(-)